MEPVSIILKVWNASQTVKLCLESLLRDSSWPFELIIVDNGSKARLKAYLQTMAQNDARVRLIENRKNMGPGYANRQGCAEASHRLLCLMDSDVLVPAGWLARLMSEFNRHPELKILAPLQPEERLVYPFGRSGEDAGRQKTDARQLWQQIKQTYAHLTPLQQFLVYSHDLPIEAFEAAVLPANAAELLWLESPPDFLSSCCVLVDGEFAARAGGIADPVFRGYGSEDVDLCWRISRAGGKVAKTSAVYVHHFLGASLADNDLNRAVALRLANQILYAKWKDLLLEQVAASVQPEGVDLVAYLESHFIYSALARNTPFIDDLRAALYPADVPEDIVWRPTQ